MIDAAPAQRTDWRARLTDPMASAVVALGITQITAWGTSYYCLGVRERARTGTPCAARWGTTAPSTSPVAPVAQGF